jgi:hypothetical protein
LGAAPAAAQPPGAPPAGTPPPAVPAAPTAGGASGAIDPNQVVDVDFGSGNFLAPLPFDVPFFLRGNAPAGAQTITARMLPFSDFVNCAAHQAELERAPSLGPASLATMNGQLKFLLPVRELEVNKYYCFEFTQLSNISPDDLQKFRDRAFAAVDAELRKTIEVPQQIKAFEDLRARLKATVSEVLGPNQVLNVPPDSFFGPGDVTQVKLRYREAFGDILQDQLQRRNALNKVQGVQAEAQRGLGQLTGSSAYRRVVSGLQQGRLGHVALDELLKTRPGALSLAQLLPGDLEFVAFGMDPSSPVNPDDIFTAAEARALVARLKATTDGLADLEAVVRALNQDPVLRAAAGLDDAAAKAALAALPDLLVAAKRALRPDLAFLQDFAARLADREVHIQAMTNQLDAQLRDILRVQATTVSGFQLRASWYIGADVGIATASRINEVFGYLGANIYLRPVNKAAHLRWSSFRGHFWPEFGKRFAFVIGLPYNDLNKAGERSGLISNRPLIVGAGFRINDLLRLGGGALIFKKNDPNPLINHQRIGSTPYFSLSVDWDVRSNFTRLFNAATGGPVSP